MEETRGRLVIIPETSINQRAFLLQPSSDKQVNISRVEQTKGQFKAQATKL